MKLLKRFALLLAGIVLFFIAVWIIRRLTPLPARPAVFEIIAHRGVHQTFSPAGVDDNTCTATRIDPPQHHFIENTIPSIAEAFKDGATVVEVEIHPTSDDHLIAFHDWTLDCRTDGHGETASHSLAELKKLDIGYGYTADGGKTFPLRGTGRGIMPSLDEILAAFPDKKLLINQKDNFPRTVRLLAPMINALPVERRKQIFYLGNPGPFAVLHQAVPDIRRLFAGGAEIRRCGKQLLLRLGFGGLPAACRVDGIALPEGYLWAVPGWPNDFLSKASAAAVPVYVLDINTVKEAEDIAHLPINGIVTDRIEIVGPALAKGH